MKVLTFGHIPANVGGKQSSGLANVIYQLAYHGACLSDVEMTLAATDVYQPEITHGNLKIMGWNKVMLLKHLIIHPVRSLRILRNVIVCKKRYSCLVSYSSLLMKCLFLDFAITKVKPEIIHLHGATAALYHSMLPRDLKLVVTLHGNVGDDANIPNHQIYAEMERVICTSERVNCLCLISTNLKEIFTLEYGELIPDTKIILNAFDSRAFHYIEAKEHKKITLCTIASFSKRKGQERVVEALTKCGCDYRYQCIGHISNSDRERLSESYKDIDFEWLGIKKPEEIREILAGCDYMILPSSTEGFGLVYLEAIACGVPVIIPKHLPLALEGDILNEKNAIRIEDSSSDAIKAVLPSLAEKKWNRKEVSESVISYTWDNIAKEYNELYKSLLAE